MSERTPYELELERQLAAVRERAANQAREITDLRRVVDARNRALDAMHWVWCDGGCATGVHRFTENAPPITDDLVNLAIRNTERLARWNRGRAWKMAHQRTGPIAWLWWTVVGMWSKELQKRHAVERELKALQVRT